MQKNTRDGQLDYLKGFGMLLVTAGHCGVPGGGIISLFHMPLFFFLSGYLFHWRPIKEFVKKKILSLYIPFVIYEIVFLTLRNSFWQMNFYCKESWSWMQPLASITQIRTELIHIILFDNVDELLAPLWFCAALFFASLAYCIIYRLKYKSKIGILCILFILGFAIKISGVNIALSINFSNVLSVAMVATFFYGFGNIFKEVDGFYYLVKIFRGKFVVFIISVLLLLSSYILGLRGGMLALSYNNPFLFFLASICGVFSYYILITWFYEHNILVKAFAQMGRNTFHIMALQFIGIKFSSIIISYILGMNVTKALEYYCFPPYFNSFEKIIGCILTFVICGLMGVVISALPSFLSNKRMEFPKLSN